MDPDQPWLPQMVPCRRTTFGNGGPSMAAITGPGGQTMAALTGPGPSTATITGPPGPVMDRTSYAVTV